MKIKVVTTRKNLKFTLAELNVTIREYRQLSDILYDHFRHGLIEDYKIYILKATDEEVEML